MRTILTLHQEEQAYRCALQDKWVRWSREKRHTEFQIIQQQTISTDFQFILLGNRARICLRHDQFDCDGHIPFKVQ
jgi:hypothetical protein